MNKKASGLKKASAEQAFTDTPRTCIMVLGMHRSGTSALTRVLNLLGAAAPKNPIGPDSNNQSGYWEPATLNGVHNQMLVEAGSRWDDWRSFDVSTLAPERLRHYEDEVKRLLLEEFGGASTFVLKDPRICRFVTFYRSVLQDLGIAPYFVAPNRNPLSVIASLAARDGMTADFAASVWLRHVLDSEEATRGTKRFFLSYEAFLNDWRSVVDHLGKALQLEWVSSRSAAASKIDEHLRRDLQHHTASTDELTASGILNSWVRDTYSALFKLTETDSEDPSALSALTRIKRDFDVATSTMGQATFPEIAARESRAEQELKRQSARADKAVAELAAVRARLAELDLAHQEVTRAKDNFSDRLAAVASDFAQQTNKVAAMHEAAAELRVELSAAQQREENLKRQAAELQAKVVEDERRCAERVEANFALETQATILIAERDQARAEEKRLHDVVDAIYSSTSWQVSAPVRGIGTTLRLLKQTPYAVRPILGRAAYRTWHRLAVPQSTKQRIKDIVFGGAPFLFGWTGAYRAWANARAVEPPSPEIRSGALTASNYVPLLDAPPLRRKPARVVAFYLPQFHPIPENDEWWGNGFTEWTNVAPAQPQFKGHYQPHVPGELGYYDLRNTAVQRRQIELARLYGIEGFCFYFYWFAGKRLLEKPLENWLADPTLDLPFCLCWANENWSRRWDGLDSEVLIAQNHSPSDDIAFIIEVARYLRDPRYIRVHGRPLLVVYRPSLLPSARETAERWRQWCRDNGIGEIYLAYTQSFENNDPRDYGFDAAIEFPPNNSSPPNVTDEVEPINDDFGSTVYDWSIFPKRSEAFVKQKYTLFRSVCPGWDNTARRKNKGTAFVNNSPALYQRWLENALTDTVEHVETADERFVFVNAWNEWAEGAHLEPDAASGYAYLQATRDALVAVTACRGPRVLVVTHDAHPHGAQLLALHIAEGLNKLGLQVDLLALGDGPMLPRFAAVAPLHRVDMQSEGAEALVSRLEALRGQEAALAIVNTTVSGPIVPLLKRAGFRVIALIHELPGILSTYELSQHARAIVDYSDKVVFPADMVRKGFEEFLGQPVGRGLVRPQGTYFQMPFLERDRNRVRREVRSQLGLNHNTRIMLSAGYADHRKGLDLFVEAAITVLKIDKRAAAVWIGHYDNAFLEMQKRRIRDAGFEDRFRFTGLVQRPQEYFFAADVYALTSREDPFPTVVMEALEATVPVVAFRGVGGFEDLLERNCGLLVDPFDTTAMGGAVAHLFSHVDQALSLARNGNAIVKRDFRFPHYVRDLMDIAGMPLPRVSVVVPNYNYARYIEERLDSISSQNMQPFEIIVLDDASQDDSVNRIEEFLSRCDIPSQLHVNETNSGSVFRQWRRGVEMARGEFVWIAEADDLADPDFLTETIKPFSNPDLVMSYCQSRQMDADGRILCPDYLDYVSDIDRRRWTQYFVADGKDEITQGMYIKNTVPNVSAVVFRREPLLRVLTAADEEIASYRNAGDWLTYIRLLENGSIAFSPRALNSHRRHQTSVTIGNFTLSQLKEIVRAQREVVHAFKLGVAAERRARAYAQKLYEQFGLASAEYPYVEQHPLL